MRLVEALLLPYDNDVSTHFDRLSDVDDALRHDLNVLISTIKSVGAWDKLDDLCVIHKNLADSLLGLKGVQDSVELKLGAPSLTFSTGFGVKATITDVSNYVCINTGINNTTGNFADDDMSGFVFMTSETGAGAADDFFGAYDNTPTEDSFTLQSDDAAPLTGLHAGTNTASAVDTSVAAGNIGFIGGTRTASNAVEVRFNGVSNTDTTASIGGAPAIDLLVGTYSLNGAPIPFNPGDLEFAAWGAGAGLTSTELSGLRDAIQTYMTARGV